MLGVDELDDEEAADLGPALRDAARVVRELTGAEQVYTCLWSHAGGRPGHVHYVVQPVTRERIDELGASGPALQTVLFTRNEPPDPGEVETFADRARAAYAAAR